MLDGFVEASKIPREALIGLEGAASFSVEPLKTKFDLMIVAIPREKALKEEDNQKLWNPVVNHGVDSLDKESKYEGRAGHTSTKGLSLEYKNANSGLVWRARRMAKRDVCLR